MLCYKPFSPVYISPDISCISPFSPPWKPGTPFSFSRALDPFLLEGPGLLINPLTISFLSHITGLWDPSSPTRNQTCPICSGSSKSHLLDLQGSPLQAFLNSPMWEQPPNSQVWNLWMKEKPGECRRVWDLRETYERSLKSPLLSSQQILL